MIDKILDYKCHPFIFGLYRIAIGFTFLIYFVLLSNRWIEFYGPGGLSPIQLRDHVEFFRPSLFSYLHTETGLWIYYAVTIAMIFAFILGRLAKLPAIFIWLTLISVENSNSNNVNAEEFVLVLFAFYAMIMPVNSTLVFDFKRRKLIDQQSPVAAWTLIPFFCHMEIIYTLSLVLKPYFEHAWIDGTLMYYAVNVYDMARFPGGRLFGVDVFKIGGAVISRVLTWASLLVEAAFPILVWVEKLRVPMVLAMIAFQIGIAITLSGVQFFSLSMLPALLLFLPSQKTHDYLFSRFEARGRRRRDSNDGEFV